MKWGAVVHLCRENGLNAVVQVVFYDGSERPLELRRNGKAIAFPAEVWHHFRSLKNIEGLGKIAGLKIAVFEKPFSHGKRDQHCDELCAELKNINAPKAVLLDPDTGIEPDSANANHVTVEEIKSVWQVLEPGDWLIVYQHACRKTDWRRIPEQKFARACGVESVQVLEAPDVVRDVVLFAAHK